MLKMIFNVFFTFMFTSISYCQQPSFDIATVENFVSEVYGIPFVENNPTIVNSFSTLLNERIEYNIEIETSDEKYPKLSSFPLNNKVNPSITSLVSELFNPDTFNILTYNLTFFSNQTLIIRIDNTDYLLIVHPQ